MMRPISLPLILTLNSLACASPDYEEGILQQNFSSKIKYISLFVDLFSGEDEAEYPDDDSDSLMRMAGMVKSGQNQGANVTCMRWTSRLVTVGKYEYDMTQT